MNVQHLQLHLAALELEQRVIADLHLDLSPRRTHPCHLEWLAPYLHRAGWRVVLYGAEYAP